MDIKISRLSFLFVCTFAGRSLFIGGMTNSDLIVTALFSIMYLGTAFIENKEEKKKLEEMIKENSNDSIKRLEALSERLSKMHEEAVATRDALASVRLGMGFKKTGNG